MSESFRKIIKKELYPVAPASIVFRTNFRNCVQEAMRRRGWVQKEGEADWDIFWAEKDQLQEVFDHSHMQPHQRINHFRNFYELTRKDLMIKNLKRFKKQLEKEGKGEEATQFNFYPVTFNLPQDYSIFLEEFKRGHSESASRQNSLWIMKPIGKAQGKGIFIFNRVSQISQWKNSTRYDPSSPQAEPYVVQKYIADPLIIGGRKFDIRLYVLVTSYQPLTVFLYRNGFARFTHHRYDNEDISNAFVHLTNVAIQKNSENYDTNKGGKWLLHELKQFLMSKYGLERVNECFTMIQRLIIQSLTAVQKVIIQDKHCFELYGFDILLDSRLKPWLLEVNASPSMTANTKEDFDLKCGILDDAFTVLDLEKVLAHSVESLSEIQKADFLQQVGGFDNICRANQPRPIANLGQFATFLGSHNNRTAQLKKLAKNCQARLHNQQVQAQQEAPKKVVPVVNKIGTKPVMRKTTRPAQKGVQSKMTLQMTTQLTQNVIANITNMSNIKSLDHTQKQFIIKKYKNNIAQRRQVREQEEE